MLKLLSKLTDKQQEILYTVIGLLLLVLVLYPSEENMEKNNTNVNEKSSPK